KGEIAKMRAWLNGLMNQPGDFYFEIDSSYKPTFTSQASYDTASLADRRADVVKIAKSIQSAALDLKALNLQKRPDLSIRFDHMSPLAQGGMPNSYSVMGMISIPIAPWASKSYKAEARAMEYDILAMEKEKEAILNRSVGLLYGLQYQIEAKSS